VTPSAERQQSNSSATELDLNLNAAEVEVEVEATNEKESHKEAQPPQGRRKSSTKVVNLFGMTMEVEDDEGESPREPESGEEEANDQDNTEMEDERNSDSDSEDGELLSENEEGEEEYEESETTEVYVSSEDEEHTDAAELEQAKEQRRKLQEGLRPQDGEEDRATKAPWVEPSPARVRAGFLVSPEQRRKNWEVKYALTKKWLAEHGKLPTNTDNTTLNNWIVYVKKTWRRLDAEQLAKVRALGVRPFQRRGGAKGRASSTTKATTKDTKADDQGPSSQPPLKRRGHSSADSAIWDAQLHELERFRAATDGHNPPYFVPIGRWLYEQIALQNKGLLSESRMARLESLGIKWDWHDEEAQPKKHHAAPQTTTRKKGRKSHNSTNDDDDDDDDGEDEYHETNVEQQGKKRRKEEEETSPHEQQQQQQREKKRASWDERFDELGKYLAQHNNHRPPNSSTLGKWLYIQRYRISKGTLRNEDKIAKLVALGIPLSLPPKPTPAVPPTPSFYFSSVCDAAAAATTTKAHRNNNNKKATQ
jgi:hypothetical protein